MARPSSGSNLSFSDLERIFNDRRKQVDKLTRKRDKAQRTVDELNAQIYKITGGAGGNGRASGGGGRARNDKPLPDYIEAALSKNGKPMRVGEIVTAVQAAGYRSTSPQFKNIVNQQLIKERKRFQQIERGLYGLAKK